MQGQYKSSTDYLVFTPSLLSKMGRRRRGGSPIPDTIPYLTI
jgi:hypothetical protein